MTTTRGTRRDYASWATRAGASTASSAPSTRSAAVAVAFRPIRPIRHIGGASGPSPPPTSIPWPASSCAWTALPVDPVGDPDRGERRHLALRVGDEREPARAERVLERRAGGGVPGPARLEPLREHQPQRLVQRVDAEDRRRVVVDRRPLDPVAPQQLEVEAERHRRAALADPPPSVRGEIATGAMPGGAARHFWVQLYA